MKYHPPFIAWINAVDVYASLVTFIASLLSYLLCPLRIGKHLEFQTVCTHVSRVFVPRLIQFLDRWTKCTRLLLHWHLHMGRFFFFFFFCVLVIHRQPPIQRLRDTVPRGDLCGPSARQMFRSVQRYKRRWTDSQLVFCSESVVRSEDHLFTLFFISNSFDSAISTLIYRLILICVTNYLRNARVTCKKKHKFEISFFFCLKPSKRKVSLL